MHHQQSFANLRISLIVLPTNRVRLVQGVVPALLQSLDRVAPRQHIVMELGGDSARWSDLRIERIVDEGDVLRHVFSFEP